MYGGFPAVSTLEVVYTNDVRSALELARVTGCVVVLRAICDTVVHIKPPCITVHFQVIDVCSSRLIDVKIHITRAVPRQRRGEEL